ncbi:MAG: (E)-4-hydroxy-3-methylbut-2-enyl-diphosphate synthase [Porphyromonas sp.]|nr:(E)-4-hydroxy-3-methylbut-2-enyl-diphosphate synthase [Porphyromonas sp.]
MPQQVDLYNYQRRRSSVVSIADKPLGGDFPIRVQSMTNTSTMDTTASVEQCRRLVEAGADYIRLTAQGVREANNIGEIASELKNEGIQTPLIADIHFNPKAAEAALQTADKVRINPGNFVDSKADLIYTDELFCQIAERVRTEFGRFVDRAKRERKAIRIGINHGSLSERMTQRYGDSPRGMVESCMEYLLVCRAHDFQDVVISMKSSNVSVMTQAVRLIAERMQREDMYYPLHLGVTEAGNEAEGRIRSALGIGTLLADGYGDTIRVSLSEDPVAEIPVARLLLQLTERIAFAPHIECTGLTSYDRTFRQNRFALPVGNLFASGRPPAVLADLRQCKTPVRFEGKDVPDAILRSPDEYGTIIPNAEIVALCCSDLDDAKLLELKQNPRSVLILTSDHSNPIGDWRRAFQRMREADVHPPVILNRTYLFGDVESLMVCAATEMGALLLEGRPSGLAISAPHIADQSQVVRIAYGILQAAGLRTTDTEYISCPGCGRTLFDLTGTIARVKAATPGLVGLKIAVMGCIVNGPGEMADADYGYVGAGRGRVDLYRHGECVEKGIPTEQAVDRLVDLIKSYGDWTSES